MAATCNLAINSAIIKNDDLTVRLYSEGHDPFEITLLDLHSKKDEINTSKALIRGIAYYLKDKGYNIGGFNIYMTSTIYSGAGVSSSAAFELLIAQLFNDLFNDNKIDKLTLCNAGQFAEQNYFGKKCGLLDQIGVAFGGIAYIDFKNISNPKIDNIMINFPELHYITVNTGGSHADLSDTYSMVPRNMLDAAKKMGHDFLIEGSEEELENKKHLLSDIEYTRALHFYHENQRVKIAKKAIEENDEKTFLKMINESRISSTNLLKNMMVGNQYEGSPLEACDLAMKIIENDGACKINGGGFAGSIVCFVKENKIEEFLITMKNKYGEENVKEIYVRKYGPGNF
jgi:galactokinase